MEGIDVGTAGRRDLQGTLWDQRTKAVHLVGTGTCRCLVGRSRSCLVRAMAWATLRYKVASVCQVTAAQAWHGIPSLTRFGSMCSPASRLSLPSCAGRSFCSSAEARSAQPGHCLHPCTLALSLSPIHPSPC